MLTTAVSFFWPMSDAPATTRPERRRQPGPIFIGDAVQPWGQDTLLLAVLLRDVRDAGDQSDE